MMLVMDLTKLPTGSNGWRDLVDWIATHDDRIERHYLEVKSDVDPNTKSGRAKIANFILGAAHRDPAVAERYFAGHALMILGISPSHGTPSERSVGIPGFEAHELRRAISKRTGEPGPHWDYVLVDVPGTSNSVAIFIVDPPNGQIWPSLGDDAENHDGAVYIRRDGETSKASGAELTQLLRRHVEHSQPGRPSVELAVRLVGSALHLDPLSQQLDNFLERHTSALHWAYDSRPKGHVAGFSTPNPFTRDRTPEEYKKQIDQWASDIREQWPRMVSGLAAIVGGGASIEISNATKTFLTGVHVDITLTGAPDLRMSNRPCTYDERSDAIDVLFGDVPERPELWGPQPYTGISVPRLPATLSPIFNQPGLLHG
jgi:hypothetical protein